MEDLTLLFSSVDGRDRAAEVGGELAQAVAVLDVRDHGQAGRWNEEDLTPGFRMAVFSAVSMTSRSIPPKGCLPG